ncbi:MAG: DMT family transporter [Chloroflexota bacterium]
MTHIGTTLRGVTYLFCGILILSLQDVIVKYINADYSVVQIVTIRSIVAIPATLVLFRLEGRRGLPTTTRHTLEYVRGTFLFLAFTAYMMAVVAIPLADLATIRNAAPLVITLLSVLLLAERVGTRHWLALIVGFLGVLLIVRPGTATFNLGTIFALTATLFYCANVIITRQLRTTDSSATMAYFSSLVYLIGSLILVPLPILVGELPSAHPSIAFMFRAWTTTTILDFSLIVAMGFTWAVGMYLLARAYSTVQASVVAPFEYIALPISAMWGFALWNEIPTLATWVGAALTVGSGLYVLYLDQQGSDDPAPAPASPSPETG